MTQAFATVGMSGWAETGQRRVDIALGDGDQELFFSCGRVARDISGALAMP